MKTFQDFLIVLETKSVTIDPRFDSLISLLMQQGQLKSKADAMRFIYDAVAEGDKQKLQTLLQIKQPDLADLIKSLMAVGKVVNLSPEIHQAFLSNNYLPEDILLVMHDALIKGDPKALEEVLQHLSRNIHSEEQKSIVANTLSKFVELRRNWKLKDLINRWLTQDEEQTTNFSGNKTRTNFEIDKEDVAAISKLLSQAVVKGKPAIRQAIAQWIRSEPKILNNISNNQGMSEEELVNKIYQILENYGEIEKAYNAIKGDVSRRGFMKFGVGFLLGGTTIEAIRRILSSGDEAERTRQDIEQNHKYAPYTLDFEPGRNATYRFDPSSQTLTIQVTPAEENNQIRLASRLITNLQNLGYRIQGRPQISEDGGSTIITVQNVIDPEGKAAALNQLVRFARRGMKEWIDFRGWHQYRVEQQKECSNL